MTKQRIYITRKLPDKILEPYKELFDIRMWEKEEEPVPREVLLEEVKTANGLFCLLTEQVDKELLEKATHLQVVANMAVGYDNIDIETAKQIGITVTNTPDVLTETTADLAFALLMATARRMLEANTYIKTDLWQHWSPFLLAGTDVHHKTLGIVGMGRIGTAIAKRAKGFDMKILYHNRSRHPQAESTLQATYTDFETLLREADFVVSVVPLSKETNKLFNHHAFQTMKKEAIFINVSRGGVVDEQALYDALQTQEIHAAGLDVFEQEPIRNSHPLLQLKNIVCLPHIGSASMATRMEMAQLCLTNIAHVLTGEEPITPVK
ncbi:D-glycerate dehydrogenase [Lentibacillus sp. N15]|uniref:2-hydroxyacid dehydrogenase n=1 Tax=Lentibacillus songyuanensis TaxID=3136161 RepID=UPI0031BB88D6